MADENNITTLAKRLRPFIKFAAQEVVVEIPADHGSLTGLTDDDHTQYVHNSTARTITAVHTFDPAPATAPFILAADAQGQLVTGLRADELNKSVTAGNGLTGGGALTASISLAVGAGDGITVNADDVALTTPGTLSVSSTNSATGSHTHAITSSSNPGAAASLLASDASGYLNLVRLNTDVIADKSGANLTLSPTGDITIDPGGNDVLPLTNYDINLGMINKKYLTLHAAELWVETLVAQDTIATIGGRILVGPTTTLIADLLSTETNLLSNPGFETLGADPPTFIDWIDEVADGGDIYAQPSTPHGGSYSCQIFAGSGGGNTTKISQYYACTEYYGYTVTFWTRGQSNNGVRYSVWDGPGGAYIVSPTATSSPGDVWTKIQFSFNTPAGCNSLYLTFWCTNVVSSYSAVDDVEMYVSLVNTKHNQHAAGDIMYMEADGKVEFMKVLNAPWAVSGGYQCIVERNLDGTGMNAWYAGDAVFNTGTTGDGYIDIYSLRSIRSASHIGPTIVGNVRTGTTYSDLIEHWAIGNLNGLYGYGVDTYGVALGKYANSQAFVAVDATNGVRMRHRDGSGTLTTKAQWWTDGGITIGETGSGKSYISIGAGALQLINDTTVNLELTTAGQIIAGDDASGEYVTIDSTGIMMYGGAVKRIEITSAGNATFGRTGGTYANMIWNASNSRLEFRSDTTVLSYIDTDGSFVVKTASGYALTSAISWHNGTTTIADVQAYSGASAHAIRMRSYSVSAHTSGIIIEAYGPTTYSTGVSIISQNGSYTAQIDVTSATSSFITLNAGSVFVGGATYTDADLQFTGHVVSVKDTNYYEGYIFIPLTSPLTSTIFAGGTFSDVSTSTEWDLSTDMSVPNQARAVLLQMIVKDTGGAAEGLYFSVGPSSSIWYAATARPTSTYTMELTTVVPCSLDGSNHPTLWYQINASGTNTMTITCRIMGYWI